MCHIIKLVTFDVTNTLIKFRQSPAKQYAEIGRAYGLKITEEQISSQFKKQFKDMWKNHPNFGRTSDLGWENWWTEVVARTFSKYVSDTKKVNDIALQLIEDYKKQNLWIVCDGSIEILDYLANKKIQIGVISNFDPRLHDILKNTGLSPYFDFIITSYESGCPKPDRRIFDSALDKCKGIESMNAVHVGDNVNLDYHGARKAGWKALLVNSDQDKFNDISSNHIYRSLIDLKNDIVNEKIKYL